MHLAVMRNLYYIIFEDDAFKKRLNISIMNKLADDAYKKQTINVSLFTECLRKVQPLVNQNFCNQFCNLI